MAINPQYVISPTLQDFFIDKTTGLPMSAGIVTFYSDIDRSFKKPIYEITGNPPDYTFSELTNPLILSGVGTYVDESGNDINVYLYPYDAEGNLELYYIVVTNSADAPQFTREAWPPFSLEQNISPPATQLTNYIPNGQFWTHFNIPATSTTVQGIIPSGQNITYLAPGGYTFEKPAGFTSVDSVTFPRFSSYTETFTASPRFAINLVNITPNSGEGFKNFCIKFNDVNKFSSDDQTYTFFFQASATTNVTIQLVTIKYFGTGGIPSSTVTTVVTPLTFTPEIQIYNTAIIFGSNAGLSLGTNNDDYVEIAFSLPVGNTFNITICDFMLIQGDTIIEQFEQETNADMLTRSVAGWMDTPDYNGMNLYLPLIQTRYGATWDSSNIGNIVLSSYPTPRNNQLFCDGAQYDATTYSALGIPYMRLLGVLTNNFTSNNPVFGSGPNFVTAGGLNGPANTFRLSTNKAGSQTVPGDNSTGFTFTTPLEHTGQSNLGVIAGVTVDPVFGLDIIGLSPGSVTAAADGIGGGATGFTFNNLVLNVGQTVVNQEFTITNFSGAVGMSGGQYFTYNAIISGSSAAFYVWYTVGGVGADPSPGGTGIQVNLQASYNLNDVAYATMVALNGQQSQTIVTTAGNTINPGAWWFFYANSVKYDVYYLLNGVGNAPIDPGSVTIPVNILNSSSAADVLNATLLAINYRFFATPNLQDKFIRVWGGGAVPLTLRSEQLIPNGSLSNYIGSYQNCAVQSHNHSTTATVSTNSPTGTGSAGRLLVSALFSSPPPTNVTINGTTSYVQANASETYPSNVYLNAFIYY